MSEMPERKKVWDLSPCPRCGRDITTHPGGRARHIRSCDGKVEDDAAKQVIEVDPLATGGPQKANLKANPTLAEEIAYAEAKTGRTIAAIERARKDAPDAIVSLKATPDRFKSEEKRLRDEGKVPEDHAIYWGDVVEHKANVHKYIPVNDDGQQPRVGENEAFHRPKALKDAEIRAAEARSRQMIQAVKDKSKEAGFQGDTSEKPLSEAGQA